MNTLIAIMTMLFSHFMEMDENVCELKTPPQSPRF
jgi:hypothetical protein